MLQTLSVCALRLPQPNKKNADRAREQRNQQEDDR
jgi:hypothetical protein